MGYKRKAATSYGGYRSKKFKRAPRRRYQKDKMSVLKTSRTRNVINVVTNAADAFAGMSFKLSDLPNYASFSLFDEYRIVGIKATFMPLYTDKVDTSGTGVLDNMPNIITAIDYDDALTPAVTDLEENETCMVHSPGVTFDRYFVPKVSKTYWAGATATGYGSATKQWIDIDSPGVNHYGLKYGVICDGALATANFKTRIYIKYYVEFRKCVG